MFLQIDIPIHISTNCFLACPLRSKSVPGHLRSCPFEWIVKREMSAESPAGDQHFNMNTANYGWEQNLWSNRATSCISVVYIVHLTFRQIFRKWVKAIQVKKLNTSWQLSNSSDPAEYQQATSVASELPIACGSRPQTIGEQQKPRQHVLSKGSKPTKNGRHHGRGQK